MSGRKLSLSLLDTKTGFTTPWHCSVALLADGHWLSAPKGEFEKDDRLELVHEDGAPSFFKERKQTEGEDTSFLSEGMASYLQPRTRRRANEYLSESSSSKTLASLATPPLSQAAISDKSASPPGVCLSGMRIPDDNALGILPVERLAADILSLPLEHQPPVEVAYGRRLLPQIMDELAQAQPERIIFILTTRRMNVLEFRNVTAREFVNAVNRTAWWIEERVGRADAVQPIGYIGPRKSPNSLTPILAQLRI